MGVETRLLTLGAMALLLTGCGSEDSAADATGGQAGTEGGLSCTPATGGSGGTAAGVQDPRCTQHCQTAASLDCPVKDEGCEDFCNSFFAADPNPVPWCGKEATAYLDCVAAAPAAAYECDDSLGPRPKSTTCQVEEDAWAHCVFVGPTPLPDITTECDALLKSSPSMECPMRDWWADCASLSGSGNDGKWCKSANTAFFQCLAGQPTSAFRCSDDCFAAIPASCEAVNTLRFTCVFQCTNPSGPTSPNCE